MKVFLLSAHLKNLSPEFPASQYPLFSPSHGVHEDADDIITDHNSDSDVQIVSETPNGDGTMSKSSTPPNTQAFLDHHLTASLLLEGL